MHEICSKIQVSFTSVTKAKYIFVLIFLKMFTFVVDVTVALTVCIILCIFGGDLDKGIDSIEFSTL